MLAEFIWHNFHVPNQKHRVLNIGGFAYCDGHKTEHRCSEYLHSIEITLEPERVGNRLFWLLLLLFKRDHKLK